VCLLFGGGVFVGVGFCGLFFGFWGGWCCVGGSEVSRVRGGWRGTCFWFVLWVVAGGGGGGNVSTKKGHDAQDSVNTLGGGIYFRLVS